MTNLITIKNKLLNSKTTIRNVFLISGLALICFTGFEAQAQRIKISGAAVCASEKSKNLYSTKYKAFFEKAQRLCRSKGGVKPGSFALTNARFVRSENNAGCGRLKLQRYRANSAITCKGVSGAYPGKPGGPMRPGKPGRPKMKWVFVDYQTNGCRKCRIKRINRTRAQCARSLGRCTPAIRGELGSCTMPGTKNNDNIFRCQ